MSKGKSHEERVAAPGPILDYTRWCVHIYIHVLCVHLLFLKVFHLITSRGKYCPKLTGTVDIKYKAYNGLMDVLLQYDDPAETVSVL